MKVEAGKYYRTRDGRKAYVEWILESNTFSSCAATLRAIGFVEGDEPPRAWTLDGHWFGMGVESGYDLIAPWIAPPWDYQPQEGEQVLVYAKDIALTYTDFYCKTLHDGDHFFAKLPDPPQV